MKPLHLLTTSALPTTITWRAVSPRLGRLLTPRHYPSSRQTAELGIEWAADNDAFSSFDQPAFERMLDTITGVAGCRFVTAPDVVGEAIPTLERFETWGPRIRERGLPAGLVLQDGMTVDELPWGSFDAVFVGGSTEWKLGAEARAIVTAAVDAGLWAHMGRVNSIKRSRIAADWGCDSIDGSGWPRFKREMIGKRWAAFEAERYGTPAAAA